MESYNNFIGIDIGKFNFVVALHNQKSTKEYENTSQGIKQFLKEFKMHLPKALCILEATGGHEIKLLLALCEKDYAAHRVHARHIKNFVRSYGKEAKTDQLDAKHLSLYGFERSAVLDRFTPPSKHARKLYELVQRRQDIKQMLVAEKNRYQSPRTEFIKKSIETMINVLSAELEALTHEIEMLIENDNALKEKKKVLKTIPGIGNIIANELLTLLPELGQLSRKEVASLVGVAPISKDSGKHKGYRHTGHGRMGVKPHLFLAAMAARNSKSDLKAFYEGLIMRGKSKMVALTALMRKIIVIANAKLKSMAMT